MAHNFMAQYIVDHLSKINEPYIVYRHEGILRGRGIRIYYKIFTNAQKGILGAALK